ncbi:MAG: right-handed parallel beta-helix repeat-containing protein [Propionibacteriales bacterium]|nr:right-handed parallel beta-helix repeat-containing protein [Propionibacteriales bacterium]
MRRFLLALAVAFSAIALVPQLAGTASAHVERPSYWPDPTADCTVSPCAGGVIPRARSLASALDRSKPGVTRVVCAPNSMVLLKRSIAKARKYGYNIRPTDHRTFSAKAAANLLRVNKALLQRCNYRQIQPAVNASGNNDRVVVMPGLYTEPRSRAQKTFDPACAKYHTFSDSGDPGALSHEAQIRCPNDANLIAIIGRGLGGGSKADPSPPREDRHGVPNAGRCIRCNFQLEGSGVVADDVIIEAGSAAAGDGGPSAAGHKKDVGIFVDRADGIVLRNIKIRHAREHGIYIIETDGYLFDRFKAYYAGAYGVLSFVGDHGVVQNCDAKGSGDSGVYPGSGAPSLLESRNKTFYPTARISQIYRWCDSHHNTGGFSGTNSSGTLITQNNFYDNALGLTTDVFTAAGHPGFPQAGNVIDGNNFYSNNFNPFKAGSDVVPFIPAPVGSGLWLAGGNENVVRHNRFFNNWRYGTMIFAVPDATVCGPVLGDPEATIPGCNALGISTSYGNRTYGNTMGVAPNGDVRPNGTDFWWDAFPTNTGNCWWNNTAAPGKRVSSNTSLPGCSGGTKPEESIGLGNVVAESELLACLAGFQLAGYPAGSDDICTWAITPKKPGTSSARDSASAAEVSARQQSIMSSFCEAGLGKRTCKPYQQGLSGLGWLNATLAPLLAPSVKPGAPSSRPLSTYTCSWWNQASPSARLELVQRIRGFNAKQVQGDSSAVGYGSTLTDSAATQLFKGRCTSGYAGGFALYKIYGAAAAFTAANS